ncbi:hypothetical protein AB9K35_16505 [Leisingera sp. XS_AS12]|uniref:hypothetical protein n=1 Tax=Leisingera sp. XS_AS12 TaxID=3241294 RepID=UPI003512E556
MVRALNILPRHIPVVLGMPVAGLLWSLATLAAHPQDLSGAGISQPEALLLVSLGGLAQTLALWLGFAAVLWAMIRGTGRRLSLIGLVSAVSGAALPLWIAAPAAALWAGAGSENATALAAAALAGAVMFHFSLGRSLSEDLHWSAHHATAVATAASLFLTSVAYLAA